MAKKKGSKASKKKSSSKKTTTKKASKAKPTKKTAKKATAKKATKKASTKKVVTKKAAPKKASPAKKIISKAIAVITPAKKQSAAIIKSESLKPGDKAPEFTLPDQNGRMVSLKDYLGKNVVVYFYPKAMTPGCTTQACGLRDSNTRLNDLDVVVLGISADPVKKLKQFEEKENLNFILLSDEDNSVSRAYHSYGPKKFMGREFDGILRQSFLIDREGKIAHVIHKVETALHHDTVVDFFKNLK